MIFKLIYKDKKINMYLKEFENVEVILTHCTQPKKWEKTLNFKPELNKIYLVHWSLLKTKKDRIKFIKVKCDDCEKIFERKIRDLDLNNNYHLCGECQNKGDRNGMFGKKNGNKQKLACKKWIKDNGSPFTWDSVKQKIKEKQSETTKKIVEKTTGQKRSEDIKRKMSISMINAIKNGRLKTWNNIKIKQYNGIDYQGSYELNFLKFVENKNKLHLIERGPRISYYLNGMEHNYYVDYKIKNTNIVFEIKSSYYWKKKEEINILKKKAAEKEYEYHLIINKNYKGIENLFI